MSYQEINNKQDLIDKLTQKGDSEVVLHFNCQFCDDEQVTYETEASFAIKQIKEFNYIPLMIPCTNCGSHINILNLDMIQGIEDY